MMLLSHWPPKLGDCLVWSLRNISSTPVANKFTFSGGQLQRPRLASRLPILLFIVLLLFPYLSSAQRDPVANFCRRFGHQTAVIDRKLYIDGGYINYAPLPSNPTNYTNTFLSYHDLDDIGSGGMPQLYANLSKNATIPSVNGGILWADDVNKRFYLFGGDYDQLPPSDLSLYSYDTLNNYWTTFNDVPQSISGVSYGAGVSVSELGEAFYYGGWSSNASMSGWKGSRKATTGLVHYHMDDNRWENVTGPDGIGRAEGVMVYIPVSDGGMLLYLGGVQDTKNGSIIGQPMDDIFVFDIATSRWYRQVASGDVPGMRAKFCAGVTWAKDQSSYNVYLYGGLGMPNYTSGYDDIYVLSLPSFTWVKLYPNTTLEQYPHNTLSCNVIDGSQMLIIGGSFPLDDQNCDSQPQFGSHSLDMGEQNKDSNPWFLYRPNITNYVVPSGISNAIGGDARGTATKTTPNGGFDEPDLKILMSRKYTAPVRSPTRAVSYLATPQSSLSNGAIAGITVSGAVVLIAIIVSLWYCFRQRRKRQAHRTAPAMSSIIPIDSHTPSGDGGIRSPGSSHPTPITPITPVPHYGTGHGPIFSRQQQLIGAGVIPNHPVEMPGHVHDSGASELHGHLTPNLAINGGVSPGDGFLVSPYSTGTEPRKYGDEMWPSPVREIEHADHPAWRTNANVYAAGGFGPQELPTNLAGDECRAERRRHETFYHR